MAIYRKKTDGVWYFSVYVPGKPRLRGSCGTKNRSEALLVESTMKVAAGNKAPKAHVLRLIEALYADEKPVDRLPLDALQFEVSRLLGLSGKTLSKMYREHRESSLRRFVTWAHENWPSAEDARDVDRVCAQAFAAYVAGLGLGAKTRRDILASLGAMWNELMRAHDGLENPWPLALPQVNEHVRGRSFTSAEARRIFEAGDADGHGWGLAARIAACTGLREGDVLRLTHEDIDAAGAIVTDPNKTKKWHIAVCLPLPRDILDLVGEGTGPIFPELFSAHGKRMKGHPFADILRAAGVDPSRYTFHSFRHYFRTRLAAAGVSADTAMRLGGWTQRDTAARYDHDDHREELAAAIRAAWAAD